LAQGENCDVGSSTNQYNINKPTFSDDRIRTENMEHTISLNNSQRNGNLNLKNKLEIVSCEEKVIANKKKMETARLNSFQEGNLLKQTKRSMPIS